MSNTLSRYVSALNNVAKGWDIVDTHEKPRTQEDFSAAVTGTRVMTVYSDELASQVVAWLNSGGTDKPRVVVRYGAGEADYTTTPPDSVDVLLIDSDAEEQLFLEHAGLRVYYAVKSMSYSGWKELSTYHVSPYLNCDCDEDETYDIRDFPEPPQEYLDAYPNDDMPEKTALRWMIDTGQWAGEA